MYTPSVIRLTLAFMVHGKYIADTLDGSMSHSVYTIKGNQKAAK